VVRVTEGLNQALFKQFLTLLGGAGYGGSRSNTLQAVFNFASWRELRKALFKLSLTLPGGAGYGGSESDTLQAVFNFARWCGLRRV
jgi:hypothetical protein